MGLECLGITHFSDVYSTPKFGLSLRGDICFCNTTDGEPALGKHRRFFLNICRADGSTSRTSLPEPPAMIEGLLYDGISCLAPQVINDHLYLGLAPEWMYGLRGSTYHVKLDWAGKLFGRKNSPLNPIRIRAQSLHGTDYNSRCTVGNQKNIPPRSTFRERRCF